MKIKKRTLLYLLPVVFLTLLLSLTYSDSLSDEEEWNRLSNLPKSKPLVFDLKMIEDQPEPVRRFFQCTIKVGTPLLKVAEIEMGGQFSLGSKEKPNYQEMIARQLLASPEGFVFQMKLPGLLTVSGSDTGKWTRFRILNIFPVARMGGTSDHSRAAFGRYVAESIFWTPAAVLPGKNIKWEELDKDTARVTIRNGELSQEVDVVLDANGCPILVKFQRWSDANPEKQFRFQPFGGRLSDFREVGGFRIPFRVEAANHFETEEEFVFFKSELKSIHFLQE
ncbi:MAG: hypothetical protein H7A24_16450 [Leptospiraceae bacterium]|nr:hypothetical protein [Leptospiraceae bacterium]MCP5513480.1 hypothetical protein [Leptospiraceae bacterium]